MYKSYLEPHDGRIRNCSTRNTRVPPPHELYHARALTTPMWLVAWCIPPRRGTVTSVWRAPNSPKRLPMNDAREQGRAAYSRRNSDASFCPVFFWRRFSNLKTQETICRIRRDVAFEKLREYGIPRPRRAAINLNDAIRFRKGCVCVCLCVFVYHARSEPQQLRASSMGLSYCITGLRKR